MENILVADIMTRSPVTIKPAINLLECAKKMVRKRVGSLLITEGKKLVGIISEKDILWALIKKSKNDLIKIRAIDISPKKIATIKPSATITEAVDKMKKLRFEKLPVIHEGELIGIITVKDILNFYPELYRDLEEFSMIREESKKLARVKKAKTAKRKGICEECGNLDLLYNVNSELICENCRNKI